MRSRAMQCAVRDTKICSWRKEVGEDLWPRVDANLRLKTDLQKIKGSSPPIWMAKCRGSSTVSLIVALSFDFYRFWFYCKVSMATPAL